MIYIFLALSKWHLTEDHLASVIKGKNHLVFDCWNLPCVFWVYGSLHDKTLLETPKIWIYSINMQQYSIFSSFISFKTFWVKNVINHHQRNIWFILMNVIYKEKDMNILCVCVCFPLFLFVLHGTDKKQVLGVFYFNRSYHCRWTNFEDFSSVFLCSNENKKGFSTPPPQKKNTHTPLKKIRGFPIAVISIWFVIGG